MAEYNGIRIPIWQVETPSFDINTVTHYITITCDTPDAIIRYQMAQATPPMVPLPFGPIEQSRQYGSPISYDYTKNVAIKAKAWKSPMIPSNVATETIEATKA